MEPDDPQALEKVIGNILGDPDAVSEKNQNARRLAADIIDPGIAVKPLVRMIEDREAHG